MFDGAQVSYFFVRRCLGVDSGGLFLGSVLALLRAQVSFSVLSDVPKVDFDSALRICKDYGFDFVQMSELV